MKNMPIRAALSMALLLIPATGFLYAQPYMTTVQYNNQRTGWNQNETALNVKNVNSATFGKLWTAQLDGMIYNAPLYVNGVVYVATEHNFIYALDASTGEQIWRYYLDTPGEQVNLGCGSLGPQIGIASTPAIDLDTYTLYAVGLTCEDTPCVRDSRQVFKMTAVDITTGEVRDGWPVVIDPPTEVPLNTRVTGNRGALLLANGMVYVPFGGYSGDCGPYHGWVVGIDKADPAAPQLYYQTPGNDATHRGSGIWASGGVAADADGYLYPPTGNSFGAPSLDYSNAVLRLLPDLSFSGDTVDYFMPSNWRALNSADADLGSSTAMLLPPQKGSNTPNLIFVTGKRGTGHLINRDDLGGVATGDGDNNEGVFSKRLFSGGAFSTAAYYDDPKVGHLIFLAGRGAQLQCGTGSGVVALQLAVDNNGNISYDKLWCTPSMSQAMSPVVTSAPDQTGILWVVDRNSGVLHAFNAATGDELYNTNQEIARDFLGTTRNFLHFTAIDGRVLVGNTNNQVVAYGLLK